ncbi:MAG: type II toxin-antitoxin system HicB family antitoxin [Fimbriimonadaceae bacterium]|nr:type II toxin-antitoxin system HicB family antitoxin [Fimbriimonadaceae bacterium]
MEPNFKEVFYESEGFWVGMVVEIPGTNTIGSTLEEARANLDEAVELALEARRHLGLGPVPFLEKESR